MMKCIATLLVLLGLSVAACASDMTGVYALIDKVVLEPNAEHPEQIQIWGAFAVAKVEDRNSYESPQRGYLYYTLPAGKEDLARREWADFKAVAGTRQVVAFGNRFQKLRLRKTDEKPGGPDVYVVGMGVVKVRSDTDYGPIKSLLEHAGR